jgi:retron-type reverse transcriptase
MKGKLALEVRRQKTISGAWQAIQRNARSSNSQETKNEIASFAAKERTNLKRISQELQKGTFTFPPARGLRIPKDKKDKANFRPLVVAKVESRIVQRAIHDVLVSVPAIQQFIKTPHSFGGVKKAQKDEMTAVPAAIQAVLDAIESGATFIIRSDITSFFTRISKSAVTDIVSKAIDDDDFLALFSRAISVELANMAQLREHANAFPITDIGVAQGNSLSPLLGNIILHQFDAELNKNADVRCIRYIDDFIILAPNRQVAENTFAKAKHILGKLGMSVSDKKTQKAQVQQGFEFLGIDLSNGFIRPSRKSQRRILDSIKSSVQESRKAFRSFHDTDVLDRSMSLLQTLTKVSGITQGWAKHYWFCNDATCLLRLDDKIGELIREYLAAYREEREKANNQSRWKLLGIEALIEIPRTPFIWKPPNKTTPPITGAVTHITVEIDQDTTPW